MKVGACIVNKNNKIVSIGHNALPESRDCNQENFPHWEKVDIKKYGFQNTKYAHGKKIITINYFVIMSNHWLYNKINSMNFIIIIP